MTTCMNHITEPDLRACSTCRMEYEEYLQRWLGKKAVDMFRSEIDSKTVLEELRKLK